MAGTELSPRYSAAEVEQKWYTAWEHAGLFQPDPDPSKQRFCITIPPPNITGSLHMGHALCYPLQDMLGRYQRLLGKSVLVLPGQDHAGIATQSVVEKQLRKQGTSGAQLGRDKFVERVWEWRKESGDTILHQFRTLGCAFDWSRSRFTLDDKYAQAVLRVFVDWFERGLIFKGKRVVNWDPILQTSVSDIETERRETQGKLYYIRYPFADGSGHVTIATTRPETMLADVAVAVHPSDKRYHGKVGKTLVLPLVNREIPLIADQYPDPEFGSGAVKITPAHDPNDFEVGRRHNLPMPVLLDERARVTEEGGPYAGLDRYEARKRIVADLEEQGFLEKVEDHMVPLLVSERSGEPIEPLLSEQWFADQPKLAGPAIEAVRSGQIQFHPSRYNKVYLDWMENIREWCVSRQLWWGHRVPVYYDAEGNAYAGISQEEAQAKAGDKKIVRQDEDVLDTWFSSGLWPFATLGWPEKTDDLKQFYPTDALITDRNIIYLWVARMIMMGLDQMGAIPFSQVYIYATVLTESGQRMSKSLGTGVDPQGIIESIGADALRYTLQSQTGENQDIRFSDRRTEEARNFCNKIWNATRFVLMNVSEAPIRIGSDLPPSAQPIDKWLMSRLATTEQVVREAYDQFDLQSACQALYQFFWSDLCDWYIEIAKPRLTAGGEDVVQWVLLTCIDHFVKMLHPVMPYITEEIYSHLPVQDKASFVMSADWPYCPKEWRAREIEAEVDRVREITRELRALRALADVTPGKRVETIYYEGDLLGYEEVIASQSWAENLLPGKPGTQALSATIEGVTAYLPVDGLIDIEKKRTWIDSEETRAREDLAKLEKRLADSTFMQRAKPEVVERTREQHADLVGKLENLDQLRRQFGL
jgi:valyl-tRNA synthetase